MKPIISPSILSADFGYLARDIEMINESEAEWVHIDIMDGVFVPNISFGFPVLKYVAKLSQKPLDVHLMIVQPEKFIPEVKALGAHVMNVHYEACPHLHRVVQQIREAGMQPAVTINPATPVSLLKDIINDVYMVLIMSVNPGFGGQKFIDYGYRFAGLDRSGRWRKLGYRCASGRSWSRCTGGRQCRFLGSRSEGSYPCIKESVIRLLD